MHGVGSGWCKMKSPADTVCVAGRIPESPSSSSARQRLRPSARVPPSPCTRALCCEGRAQPGCTASAGPLWGRGSDPGCAPRPPEGPQVWPGAGGPASLAPSPAKRVWPRPPPWKRGAQAPAPQSRLPAPSPPTSALRAPPPARPGPWGQRQSAWVRGGGSAQRPGDGDPCSRPRSASPPSRRAARGCQKLREAARSRLRLPGAPPPRAAAAAAAATSRARPDPGLSARRPARRARGPGGQRPPRRASVPAARPLAPRAPRGPGRQAPGPGMSAQQRDRRPRAAAPVRRVPPLRSSPGGGGGCRDPRWPRRRPAPVSFA